MNRFQRMALGKLIILTGATVYFGLSDANWLYEFIFLIWTGLWFFAFIFVEEKSE